MSLRYQTCRWRWYRFCSSSEMKTVHNTRSNISWSILQFPRWGASDWGGGGGTEVRAHFNVFSKAHECTIFLMLHTVDSTTSVWKLCAFPACRRNQNLKGLFEEMAPDMKVLLKWIHLNHPINSEAIDMSLISLISVHMFMCHSDCCSLWFHISAMKSNFQLFLYNCVEIFTWHMLTSA